MKHRKQRRFRLAAALSAGMLLCSVSAGAFTLSAAAAELQSISAAATPDLSETAVRNAMLALKASYPEGTPYTNNNYYAWHGGLYSGGYGCAGFAFMLSDAAFGTLPARKYTDYSKIRVGDILRINNDAHSVIVTEIYDDHVVIAEGNYGGAVHWGRTLTFQKINDGSTVYAITRYPEESAYITGDLNGDGKVGAEDAQNALQAYVNLLAGKPHGLTNAQFKAADVNNSGTLTADDAQIILQYYVNALAGKTVKWENLYSKQYDTSGFGAKWPTLFAEDDTVTVTDTGYRSHDICIEISEQTFGDSTCHIADIYLRSTDCFKYAFAQDGNPETYANGLVTGLQENIITMCDRTDAVLAINADFMGGRTYGYVIRDGYTWRAKPWNDVAALYRDGSVETFAKEEFDEAAAYEKGILHSFAFGPALVRNGEVQSGWTAAHLTPKEPRSGFGYYEPGHYCFVAADGRGMGGSAGLTAEEFAEFFGTLGCQEAFNLDGGKTSQLVFNGNIVNLPDGYNGKASSLRGMSDIFYIGEAN